MVGRSLLTPKAGDNINATVPASGVNVGSGSGGLRRAAPRLTINTSRAMKWNNPAQTQSVNANGGTTTQAGARDFRLSRSSYDPDVPPTSHTFGNIERNQDAQALFHESSWLQTPDTSGTASSSVYSPDWGDELVIRTPSSCRTFGFSLQETDTGSLDGLPYTQLSHSNVVSASPLTQGRDPTAETNFPLLTQGTAPSRSSQDFKVEVLEKAISIASTYARDALGRTAQLKAALANKDDTRPDVYAEMQRELLTFQKIQADTDQESRLLHEQLAALTRDTDNIPVEARQGDNPESLLLASPVTSATGRCDDCKRVRKSPFRTATHSSPSTPISLPRHSPWRAGSISTPVFLHSSGAAATFSKPVTPLQSDGAHINDARTHEQQGTEVGPRSEWTEDAYEIDPCRSTLSLGTDDDLKSSLPHLSTSPSPPSSDSDSDEEPECDCVSNSHYVSPPLSILSLSDPNQMVSATYSPLPNPPWQSPRISSPEENVEGVDTTIYVSSSHLSFSSSPKEEVIDDDEEQGIDPFRELVWNPSDPILDSIHEEHTCTPPLHARPWFEHRLRVPDEEQDQEDGGHGRLTELLEALGFEHLPPSIEPPAMGSRTDLLTIAEKRNPPSLVSSLDLNPSSTWNPSSEVQRSRMESTSTAGFFRRLDEPSGNSATIADTKSAGMTGSSNEAYISSSILPSLTPHGIHFDGATTIPTTPHDLNDISSDTPLSPFSHGSSTSPVTIHPYATTQYHSGLPSSHVTAVQHHHAMFSIPEPASHTHLDDTLGVSSRSLGSISEFPTGPRKPKPKKLRKFNFPGRSNSLSSTAKSFFNGKQAEQDSSMEDLDHLPVRRSMSVGRKLTGIFR